MDPDNKIEAWRWRQLAGWVGAGLCCLAVMALLDGLLSRVWEPASLIKLLPGMTAEINGPLGEEVRGVQELTYLSDSNDLTLTFAAVHKGYFLGGDMWRGRITASSRIPPGEYHLTVAPRRSATSRATPAFRIVVFADPVSLRRSSKSLVRAVHRPLSLVGGGALPAGHLAHLRDGLLPFSEAGPAVGPGGQGRDLPGHQEGRRLRDPF